MFREIRARRGVAHTSLHPLHGWIPFVIVFPIVKIFEMPRRIRILRAGSEKSSAQSPFPLILLYALGATGAFSFSEGNAFLRRPLILVNSQKIVNRSTVMINSRNCMNIPVHLSA
jgi:hypothetical protein